MQKRKWVWVIVGLAIALLVPFALEFLVFRNEIYSALTNADWSSFLGSYIGGALGGTGTLLAVYITTKETREIQKENEAKIQEDREIYAKRERKLLVDKVSESVAEYISEISAYFYSCRNLERLDKERDNVNCRLENLKSKLRAAKTEDEKVSLEDKKSELEDKLQRLERDIELKSVDRLSANKCYFLLLILLQNIEEGRALVEQLKKIHKGSANVELCFNWMDEETRILQNITVQFAEKYVEQ